MTQVCLVGDPDVNVRYELLSRETARDALATYDLQEPFANCLAVETVSLGAAVSLLNDLNWYLVRFADAALVREPSISETEWLSRELATAVRDDEVDPGETGRFLMVYGVVSDPTSVDDADADGPARPATPTQQDAVEEPSQDGVAETTPPDAEHASDVAPRAAAPAEDADGPPHLVEPMLVTRTGDVIPEYDLRDVEETVVVRVTENEFGA